MGEQIVGLKEGKVVASGDCVECELLEGMCPMWGVMLFGGDGMMGADASAHSMYEDDKREGYWYAHITEKQARELIGKSPIYQLYVITRDWMMMRALYGLRIDSE